MVDDAKLPLRVADRHELVDDLRHRVRGRAHGPGTGRAPERAHAAHHKLGAFARQERHERLLEHDERVAADDDLAFLGEIQGHDRNVFHLDVLPDVELRPVRQREDADAFAGADAAVEQRPQFRPLVFRIPLAFGVAQREDALLRARSFFVAPRPAKCRVESSCLERVEQRARLEETAAALGAQDVGLSAVGNRLGVRVHDQPGADLGRVAIAKLDHFAELVCGVDVEQRERNGPRIKRFLGQTEEHRRILADRVEHDRALELGGDLANDVDALRLERAQMVQLWRRCPDDRFQRRCLHTSAQKKSPDVFARAFDPSAWLSGILDVRDYANGRSESAGTLRVLQQQHAHARPRANITAGNVYHLGAGKSIGASAQTRDRARVRRRAISRGERQGAANCEYFARSTSFCALKSVTISALLRPAPVA